MVSIRPILQSMVEDVNFDDLPSNWSMLDTASFSKSKKLWDFQQEALKNAIKVLYLYFKEDQADKKKFYQRYKLNGLDEDLEKSLDIKLSKIKRKVLFILQQYYPIEDDRIKFHNFINRVAFWMATGSGKTLLIVKLVEVLKRLMVLGEIPKKDILILTHRDDLISQLKKHIEEFNELATMRGFRINLVELIEYDKVKRENLTQFFNGITVFYYRSDLISDEQKEKIIDFRNYENGGNWYIILDEAHKGDKEESKRQMLYAIISRNGFLFNFSATFTDPRDIITTAYNFNLERFISAGYGKHIYILKQEMRAFREKEDYNTEEKQKIVLKALILLTYLKKVSKNIRKMAGRVYHEPLMLTLVNTVNLTEAKKEKPDLTIFFEEIEKIGKGKINESIFEEAKEELLQEFIEKPELVFENIPTSISEQVIRDLTIKDILREVYNSESFGNVEIILIPGKRQEAVFKLKTSDRPFALIKIGDAIKWIRENLRGYEIIESYEDKSIFENLDKREDISILMGSRAFYEGWDSNRPNIILFINIGVGKEAKKFVIQSVGRGIRIEPVKGKRRRLKHLFNRGEDGGLFQKIGPYVQPIETLFIFGTNRKALSEVITTLEVEKGIEEVIELEKNEEADKRVLLIPIFRTSDKKLYQLRTPQKFAVSEELLNLLEEYFTTVDDRVLLVQNNLYPELLLQIRQTFSEKEKYYRITSERSAIPIWIAVQRLINHFNLKIEEFERFKLLEEEIIHFKKIKVLLEKQELEELRKKIKEVLASKDVEKMKEALKDKLRKREISIDEFTNKLEKLTKLPKEKVFKELKIKNILNHYYLPLILSEREKVDYIKHIIKTRSEVKFIEDLEKYIENDRKVRDGWWMFSKIDEHLDEVYIPYYDPNTNKIRKFKPDFVFWFNKESDYFIVFVDPKGIKHTEFEHKVDWFKKYFGDIDSPKIFEHEGYKTRVLLYLYTEDKNLLSEGYKKYWFDKIADIFSKIEEELS